MGLSNHLPAVLLMSKAKRKKKRTAEPLVTGAENQPDTGKPAAAPASPALPEVTPQAPAARKRPGLSLLLVLLAALLPYLNSLDNGFVLDDQELIVANSAVRGSAALGAFFTSDFWEAQNQGTSNHYRPMEMVSFALNHRLGGVEPLGCHLTNLLLHIMVCILLLLVLRRLLPRGMLALAAALLFAVHPVNTEAVSAVGGRAFLLAALFFFAAWLVHLAAHPQLPADLGPGARNRQRVIGLTLLTMGLFLLALLSSGNAAGLVAVVLLGDLLRRKSAPAQVKEPADKTAEDDFYTPDRQPFHQRFGTASRSLSGLPLSAYAGLLAVLTFYLALRRLVLGSVAGTAAIPFLDNPLASADTPVRVMTAVNILGEYLRLQLWPVSLSADYGYNQVKLVNSPLDPGFLATLVACLALLVGAAVLWRRARGRTTALGILFFFCTIIPASNIFVPIGTIMAERLIYLPSIGFCLVLASIFCLCSHELCGPKQDSDHQAPKHRASRILMVILLVSVVTLSYAGRTISRNRDWHDQQTLFLSAARVSPDSARVHCDLGVAFFERGQYQEATRSLERALDIHSDFPLALYTLGRARIELGRMEGAREALLSAAELRPDHPEILLALGALEFRLDRLEDATALFRRVLAIDPENVWAMQSLGICLSQNGSYEEAVSILQSCLERRPGDIGSHFNLATALRSASRLEEAETACRTLLDLDPDHRDGLLTLADICLQTGRQEEAASLRTRALGQNL
jgi:Flp pilus assembly protein TadD